NVDLEHMSNVSHFNIDKNNVLQGMVIRDILTAVSASPRAPLLRVTRMAAKAAALPNAVQSLKIKLGPPADNRGKIVARFVKNQRCGTNGISIGTRRR